MESKVRIRLAASAATLLIALLEPMAAQAQSMQSISDKISQLQITLNAFVATTASNFASVGTKLDAILEKLSAAAPTTVTTPPMLIAPSAGVTCVVLNSGASPVTLTFGIYKQDGSQHCNISNLPTPMAAGTVQDLSCSTPNNAFIDAYCKVTVATGSASEIKATLCTATSPGSCVATK